MAAGVLILVGFAIMGWSALGLINPVRFAEGARGRAFGVGVIGFALFMVGGSMLEPESELTPATRPAPAMGDVIRGGVHTESDFRVAVAQFFDEWPDEGDVVGARAVGNNLTVTMNWMGTRFLPEGGWTCEQERELAEYFLENWKEDLRETTQDLPNTATDFDIGGGASITFTSLAGRVLASADESSTTPLCD